VEVVKNMTEDEFEFKGGIDPNTSIKTIGESLAQTTGSSAIKCKGIRIFYVNENDMLMSS
jgi:hypothetical protein